jgi:hypothetical protein
MLCDKIVRIYLVLYKPDSTQLYRVEISTFWGHLRENQNNVPK